MCACVSASKERKKTDSLAYMNSLFKLSRVVRGLLVLVLRPPLQMLSNAQAAEDSRAAEARGMHASRSRFESRNSSQLAARLASMKGPPLFQRPASVAACVVLLLIGLLLFIGALAAAAARGHGQSSAAPGAPSPSLPLATKQLELRPRFHSSTAGRERNRLERGIDVRHGSRRRNPTSHVGGPAPTEAPKAEAKAGPLIRRI